MKIKINEGFVFSEMFLPNSCGCTKSIMNLKAKTQALNKRFSEFTLLCLFVWRSNKMHQGSGELSRSFKTEEIVPR